MRILLTLVLVVSAQAQESAFSRIKVVPRGAGVGSIDFYETRANGSSYTRLAGADAMNANRILTLPNEGAVNSEIVAQLMYRHSDSTPLYMAGYRSRGTEASPTAVAYGDVLYNWSGYAYNGSSFVSGSAMTMYVSQASPLEVSFAWATRDATNYTTRLELSASGNLRPDSVISQDLGASSYPWRDVFTKFLKMRSADGANYYISHKTPNLTASHDLVWPDANAAGALTNDGSGALSWDPSGGAAPPVAWDLDTASDVLTLGSHLSGAAQQLVTRFSRGTTASPTAVSNGDQFLQMTFQYYAGSGYKDAAAIFAYVAGHAGFLALLIGAVIDRRPVDQVVEHVGLIARRLAGPARDLHAHLDFGLNLLRLHVALAKRGVEHRLCKPVGLRFLARQLDRRVERVDQFLLALLRPVDLADVLQEQRALLVVGEIGILAGLIARRCLVFRFAAHQRASPCVASFDAGCVERDPSDVGLDAWGEAIHGAIASARSPSQIGRAHV